VNNIPSNKASYHQEESKSVKIQKFCDQGGLLFLICHLRIVNNFISIVSIVFKTYFFLVKLSHTLSNILILMLKLGRSYVEVRSSLFTN
jgi:hypothetical protein